MKLVKKLSWPSGSVSLDEHLSQHQGLSSCWQQLNPASSCLSSTAVNFLMETILTSIHRPGLLVKDSWVTVDATATPPLDFLKDKVLLLAGTSEPLGAELLQLLLQPATALKQLLVVTGRVNKMRRELEEVIKSCGFPVVKIDASSQGTCTIRYMYNN